MDYQWKQLSLKQQLAGILEAFKTQGNEIWDKNTQIPGSFTMHLDPSKSKIAVQSDNYDIRGRPTYEWELWRDTGRVVKTTRT